MLWVFLAEMVVLCLMWIDHFEMLFAVAKCYTVAGVGLEMQGNAGSTLNTGERGAKKASTLYANCPSSYASPSSGAFLQDQIFVEKVTDHQTE